MSLFVTSIFNPICVIKNSHRIFFFLEFPAGIVLTFPQRVIALESLVQYPTNKNLPFPVRGEISLYPDKNKPQTKTAARFSFDVNGNDKQGEASALIGFSHPRIGKVSD